MSTTATKAGTIPRINSVDILRGLVMIIMALDHIRDAMYPIQFDPADVSQTYPALFFTRWITHICAPVFVFLSGTSAFLWENIKGKTKKQLSWLLFSRGIWLMVVEITIINVLWNFHFNLSDSFLQVIWVIGLSMVVLSALIYLPWRVLLGVCLATILLHNGLDDVTFEGGISAFIWGILHVTGPLYVGDQYLTWMVYPLIPWFAVLGLGYCFGRIFQLEEPTRKKFLIRAGLLMVAGFIILRALDFYGDPKGWSEQGDLMFSFMSFLNTEKYPPSLLFLLMTLGPSMFLMAWFEKARGKWTDVVSIYGKVPFFYYITHLFLAHLAALIMGVAVGYKASDFMVGFWAFPEGYGFGLIGAYLVTFIIVAALYPVCKWYAGLKKRSKNPLLTYL